MTRQHGHSRRTQSLGRGSQRRKAARLKSSPTPSVVSELRLLPLKPSHPCPPAINPVVGLAATLPLQHLSSPSGCGGRSSVDGATSSSESTMMRETKSNNNEEENHFRRFEPLRSPATVKGFAAQYGHGCVVKQSNEAAGLTLKQTARSNMLLGYLRYPVVRRDLDGDDAAHGHGDGEEDNDLFSTTSTSDAGEHIDDNIDGSGDRRYREKRQQTKTGMGKHRNHFSNDHDDNDVSMLSSLLQSLSMSTIGGGGGGGIILSPALPYPRRKQQQQQQQQQQKQHQQSMKERMCGGGARDENTDSEVTLSDSDPLSNFFSPTIYRRQDDKDDRTNDKAAAAIEEEEAVNMTLGALTVAGKKRKHPTANSTRRNIDSSNNNKKNGGGGNENSLSSTLLISPLISGSRRSRGRASREASSSAISSAAVATSLFSPSREHQLSKVHVGVVGKKNSAFCSSSGNGRSPRSSAVRQKNHINHRQWREMQRRDIHTAAEESNAAATWMSQRNNSLVLSINGEEDDDNNNDEEGEGEEIEIACLSDFFSPTIYRKQVSPLQNTTTVATRQHSIAEGGPESLILTGGSNASTSHSPQAASSELTDSVFLMPQVKRERLKLENENNKTDQPPEPDSSPLSPLAFSL